MNRLQFSLAFNYLNVLYHSNNKEEFPDTAFTHSVGSKMSLSVLDWFLPNLMVFIYIACKIDAFNKCLRMIGYEEKGRPTPGNREHELAISDGKLIVLRGRATLGLGADGASVEDRERANEMSRNRTKLIFARMEARRAGLDPDSIGRLEDAGISKLESGQEGGGGGGGHVAGGGGGSAVRGALSLDTFNKSASAPSGSVGGSVGGLLSLSSLAARAAGGKATSESQRYGVVDHGDDDSPAHTSPTARAGSQAPSSAFSNPAPVLREVEAPPTLSQLLRSGRRGDAARAAPLQAKVPQPVDDSNRARTPGAVLSNGFSKL